MELQYRQTEHEDAEGIYQLNKQLILEYENVENIDLEKVLCWVRKKVTACIQEYTTIYADGEKAGYYRFCRNQEGIFEIDDLYIFPEYQNRGIGSEVIRKCCESASEPVMLYVFIRNRKALSLYQRLGFEIVETIKDSRYIMKSAYRLSSARDVFA